MSDSTSLSFWNFPWRKPCLLFRRKQIALLPQERKRRKRECLAWNNGKYRRTARGWIPKPKRMHGDETRSDRTPSYRRTDRPMIYKAKIRKHVLHQRWLNVTQMKWGLSRRQTSNENCRVRQRLGTVQKPSVTAKHGRQQKTLTLLYAAESIDLETITTWEI